MKLYNYRERSKRETRVCWNEDSEVGTAIKTRKRSKRFGGNTHLNEHKKIQSFMQCVLTPLHFTSEKSTFVNHYFHSLFPCTGQKWTIYEM